VPGIKEGIRHERWKWDAHWLAFTLVARDIPTVRGNGTLLDAIIAKVARAPGNGNLPKAERQKYDFIEGRRRRPMVFEGSNIAKAMVKTGIDPTLDNYAKLRMACKRALLEADSNESQPPS